MLLMPTVVGVTNETPYVTVSEAVERLKSEGVTVTRQTIRRWAKGGKVRSRRLTTGRQILVSVEDLVALIQPIEVGAA
jgi:predicted site-specific integrase-resolvase